jgi:hypothetical protein
MNLELNSQSPGISHLPNSRVGFERFMQAMEAEVLAAALMVTQDASVRVQYQQQIRALSIELSGRVARKELTWHQAAGEAQATRNAVMELMRARSSAVGLAFAQQMKAQGMGLNELIAKYTVKIYGPTVQFQALRVEQQNVVYRHIVEQAGQGRASVNTKMLWMSRAARGLLVTAIAVSVYQIATAQDKVATAQRELAIAGGSIAGGMAGGALAGLACGPGAPACVAIGAFVGGALAAFGVASIW